MQSRQGRNEKICWWSRRQDANSLIRGMGVIDRGRRDGGGREDVRVFLSFLSLRVLDQALLIKQIRYIVGTATVANMGK